MNVDLNTTTIASFLNIFAVICVNIKFVRRENLKTKYETFMAQTNGVSVFIIEKNIKTSKLLLSRDHEIWPLKNRKNGVSQKHISHNSKVYVQYSVSMTLAWCCEKLCLN